jgi:hypothetical protein
MRRGVRNDSVNGVYPIGAAKIEVVGHDAEPHPPALSPKRKLAIGRERVVTWRIGHATIGW